MNLHTTEQVTFVRQRTVSYPAIPTALLLAIVLFVFARSATHFMDDAYIGFRCIDQALSGNGFYFQPSDPVESVTNIGWLLLLLPFSALASPLIVSKILGGLCILLVIGLLHRIIADLNSPSDRRILSVFVPLLAVTQIDFLYYSLSGLETGLLAAMLLYSVRISRSPDRSTLLGIMCGLMYLVRPETILLYPLFVLLRLTKARSMMRGIIAFGLIVLCVTLLRVWYFDSPFPNTFTAKSTSLSRVTANLFSAMIGKNTNLPFPLDHLLAIPFLIVGVQRLFRFDKPQAAFVLAILTVGFAFSVYASQDWTLTARYFAPYLPVAMLVLVLGICRVLEKISHASATLKSTGKPIINAALSILTLTLIIHGAARMSDHYSRHYPGYVMQSANLVAPAMWINDHLPVDATIATRRIGVVAYFGDRAIFDYKYGLPHRDIAELIRENGRTLNDPTDKALAEIWRQTAPEYFLEDTMIVDGLKSTGAIADNVLTIHGSAYAPIKSFPIGQNTDWTLWQRTSNPATTPK